MYVHIKKVNIMKNFVTLCFAFILTLPTVVAQNVSERKVSMSLGSQNAFVVDVEGADKKIVESVFKNTVKEYGKLQENKKARELFMMATKINRINGSSPIDLYAKFEEGKGMATAYVWIDLGGAFTSSREYQKQAEALKDFLQGYYYECRKVVVQNELKQEEKSLDKLEKELVRLKKQNDGYHMDIEKAKQKIAEAEKNIEQNIIDQANKTNEIEGQKKTVETVTTKLNSIGKN